VLRGATEDATGRANGLPTVYGQEWDDGPAIGADGGREKRVVSRIVPAKCPKCGGSMVVRGQEEEVSCLQCGYVEYHPGEAGGNGSSGPAAVVEIPAEKGNGATGAVDEWIQAGEQLLATLEKERACRRKELTALVYQIRILRWRVHGSLARYWSPEKRAAQAERMRAMNKEKVKKGVSAAVVR